jgi:hypothetical protein
MVGTPLGNDEDGELSRNPEITWRVVRSSCGRAQPKGSLIRAYISGREVPTYRVSRHPENWGFIMQSCWVMYTSWPMPSKAEEMESPGGLVWSTRFFTAIVLS